MLTTADRSVAVPLERARSAGLEPDQVKINPKYGGGYPANVEGLHQLHCLVSVEYNSLAHD
jgi:Mycotoxin biosynthesis protein UstYa